MRKFSELTLSRSPVRILWAAFLISLPVTSFPYLPRALGGATTVRPLATLPLIILIVLLVWQRIFKERLPRSYLPLLVFVLVAAAGGLIAILQPTPPFRGVTVLDRVVRNFLTLGLGISFYLVVSLIPRGREDLRFTLKWLLIGFSIALAWSSFQSLYVLFGKSNPVFWDVYYDRLNEIHHLVSTRNLQPKRVTGLAYEPSWFAEQLSILVLPFLLIFSVRRISLFKWRFKGIQLEDLLLIWVVGMMILTFSRTGLVIMTVLIGITVLIGSGLQPKQEASFLLRMISTGKFWQRFALLIALMVILGAVVFSAGSRNNYFSRLWRYWTDEQAGGSYWTYIAFGQRFVYWEAALNMYEDAPVLGVGLGNFALFFEEYMPDVPLYRYPEVVGLIVPLEGKNQLVTPKNLFFRLLAETGLLGFMLFAIFLTQLLREALSLWWQRGEDSFLYALGRGGVLGLAAVILVAFSTDSFAIPNMWVLAGLITAAYRSTIIRDVEVEPVPNTQG